MRRRALVPGLLLAAACSGESEPVDAGPGTPDAAADGGVVDDAGADPVDAGAVTPDAGPVDAGPSRLDQTITQLLEFQTVPQVPLPPPPAQDPAEVALGEALFYDPILSGNKDVACASCHQPESGTGDALPLALGTGATGRGTARAEGDRPAWGRRHSPELWNRSALDLLFWDGRVSTSSTGGRPAPDGVDTPLAIQALHPILDPTEMLGMPGDNAVDGTANELAGAPPEDVYTRLEARLRGIPGYVDLFAAAYGAEAGVTIAGVVNAIAAFQTERFAAVDSPWDRYLRGDLSALDDAAKVGAQVFFGAGQCTNCHSGPMFTDDSFHNIGVPLLDPVDEGQVREGRFAFKTPPLRMAAAAPPYMHNGTLGNLQEVLRHYANPEATSVGYTGDHLPVDLQARIVTDPEALTALQATLSTDLPTADNGATPVGLSNVRQFLLRLVDEAAIERAAMVPQSVPSGLVVGGL